MNKIYIMSARIGTELQTPFCGTEKEVVNKMEEEFDGVVMFLRDEHREFNAACIEADNAIIVSGDDYYEWKITVQDLSEQMVADIHYAEHLDEANSILENYLSSDTLDGIEEEKKFAFIEVLNDLMTCDNGELEYKAAVEVFGQELLDAEC